MHTHTTHTLTHPHTHTHTLSYTHSVSHTHTYTITHWNVYCVSGRKENRIDFIDHDLEVHARYLARTCTFPRTLCWMTSGCQRHFNEKLQGVGVKIESPGIQDNPKIYNKQQQSSAWNETALTRMSNYASAHVWVGGGGLSSKRVIWSWEEKLQ